MIQSYPLKKVVTYHLYNCLDSLMSIIKSDLNLTIIIVNYRSWDSLSLCLNSINKKCNKVVVVDNYSNDDKLKTYKKKYIWVNWIENSKNFGFSKPTRLQASCPSAKPNMQCAKTHTQQALRAASRHEHAVDDAARRTRLPHQYGWPAPPHRSSTTGALPSSMPVTSSTSV